MVRTDDFFMVVMETPSPNADPWALPSSSLVFDQDLVAQVRRGPIEGRTDLEIAVALCQLVHDELQRYGTDGSQTLQDDEISAAILALGAVLRRVTVPFALPFRNFTTFRSYWIKNGCSNSWQARRDMLDEIFEPLYLRLVRLEEQSLEALALAISPRAEVGWPIVDEEIRELRRRFATAVTPQDYRAIGTNCVGVLEALGETVYNQARHLRTGETAPPRDKTNLRIGRYIEDALPGRANEDVRGLANKAAALAHHVKHAPTPTRRDAGIVSDAVILLANILRRLEQDL
ncbi:MAG TPA: hypothetical protein VFU43_03970 [Streptosporangiaceae bacterium]|nr:hypothetical protein [Streptosporangiaceae bacterium]